MKRVGHWCFAATLAQSRDAPPAGAMRVKVQQVFWHGKVCGGPQLVQCRLAILLTRALVCCLSQDNDPGAVYSLDFNPATGHLATGGSDAEVKARRWV